MDGADSTRPRCTVDSNRASALQSPSPDHSYLLSTHTPRFLAGSANSRSRKVLSCLLSRRSTHSAASCTRYTRQRASVILCDMSRGLLEQRQTVKPVQSQCIGTTQIPASVFTPYSSSAIDTMPRREDHLLVPSSISDWTHVSY